MRDLALLVNEAATHALQLDDGAYDNNRAGAINDAMIRRHLAGAITLAAPVVSDQGTCRFLTIDDDFHKRDADTADVRRDIFARAVSTRRIVEETGVVPGDAILSLLTGGAGSHTDILLSDEPVADVVLVAHAIQALVGETLGTAPRALEAFPSTPSSPANGRSSRIVRLPGLYRPTQRWAELLSPTENGWIHRKVNTIDSLGARPLDHREFANFCAWASDQQSRTNRWFGRRIEAAPTVSRRMPRSLSSLAHVQRFCPVFRDSMARILGTHVDGSFDWMDSIFVASIAGQAEGALEAIATRARGVGGYAGELLAKIQERQRTGVKAPMTCRSAQRDHLCPFDCPARRLTGVRSPADLMGVSDADWLAKRIATEKMFSLADARGALAGEFKAAIRHLLPESACRSLVTER